MVFLAASNRQKIKIVGEGISIYILNFFECRILPLRFRLGIERIKIENDGH